MLETLVPSRIRRTLLEYLLTHPSERVYLRGLAKALGLPISPLRRELKRLERAGMLKATPEANILFYSVDPASPIFLQLRSTGQMAEAPSVKLEAQGSRLKAEAVETAVSLQPSAFSLQPSELPASSPQRFSSWRSPLSSPMLIGAAAVGLALVVIAAGLFYLTFTNQRFILQASHALTTPKAQVTVVTPLTSAGTMRGSRWKIVPGGFGGFSSGSNQESY